MNLDLTQTEAQAIIALRRMISEHAEDCFAFIEEMGDEPTAKPRLSLVVDNANGGRS